MAGRAAIHRALPRYGRPLFVGQVLTAHDAAGTLATVIAKWRNGSRSGRRIVVRETRELGQLVRMLEERGAETVA
jgi:hypothetical protein